MRLLAAAITALAIIPTTAVHADEPRDPFTVFGADLPQPDPHATPLEKIPLEQLKLTGVLLGASPKALFEGPDGQGYIARVGDSVGTHHARIERINANGLVLVETWRDGIDRVIKRRQEIAAPGAVRTAALLKR